MNQVTLQVTAAEEKLAGRVNPQVTNSLAISDHAGGLAFANVEQVMEVAKLMAISQVAVPKHLRGNPGACIAVCIQAIEWRMSPFAVANKSYSVNDRMAYEAQLIHAVILQRAPIKGRLKVEYLGEGGRRRCRVWAELQDTGEVVEYLSPEFDKILPKNSPLWKTDPDQQHFYNASRAFCRRHFPDVLLGVYAKDEIEDAGNFGPDRARDVTPRPSLASRLKSVPADAEGFSQEHVDAETGEVLEQGPVDEAPATEADNQADPSTDLDGAEHNDDDLPAEDTLLDRARAKALEGSRAFKSWKGKLTQKEFDEIQEALPVLEAAAKQADGVAA
ncbi:recombinase RecT [Labrys neptuniae]|uniref:Recombinase RecT n=1 Tax=Labrys neptuniae TaxID=376174 RepID=A0ABV3PGN4_9HYPH